MLELLGFALKREGVPKVVKSINNQSNRDCILTSYLIGMDTPSLNLYRKTASSPSTRYFRFTTFFAYWTSNIWIFLIFSSIFFCYSAFYSFIHSEMKRKETLWNENIKYHINRSSYIITKILNKCFLVNDHVVILLNKVYRLLAHMLCRSCSLANILTDN